MMLPPVRAAASQARQAQARQARTQARPQARPQALQARLQAHQAQVPAGHTHRKTVGIVGTMCSLLGTFFYGSNL